jgi:formylglycine-generating enzyme required for sulfatase activity
MQGTFAMEKRHGRTKASQGFVHLLKLFLLTVALIVGAVPAHAQSKLALVIGIDVYPNLGATAQLERAVADAEAVGRRLDALGFKVTRLTALRNTGLDAVVAAFETFKSSVKPKDLVVLFYAGHGMGMANRTYLLPADVKAEDLVFEAKATRVAIDEGELTEGLVRAGATVIAVIDACRTERLSRAVRGPGERALHPAPTEGIFKLYSASEGQSALDFLPGVKDDDKNSVFTRIFLKNLDTPGLDLSRLGTVVRDEVDELARRYERQQTPVTYDRLIGSSRLVLVPAPLVPPDQTAMIGLPQKPAVPPADPCAGLVGLGRSGERGIAPRSFSTDCAAALTDAQERRLNRGDSFKECANCPEMVVVPAGGFIMGSPATEKERENDEEPLHRVTFAQPFAVGRFAVTFNEWDTCVSAGGCNKYTPADQGWGRGRRPVINVSWNDAQTYVAWLSRTTGKTYRLLSEAEREYVTRAGTSTPFWWGTSITTQQANYGNADYGSVKGEYGAKTLPVDSFQPNPWGLFQVHGNVWEWTEDCYHASYVGAPSDGSAWISGDCSRHVLRGGALNYDSRILRAAIRDWNTLGSRDFNLGFRVGRTLLPL